MKCFRLIVLVLIFNSLTVFSQEKLTKHTIAKGETITSIAQKYKVSPKEIYEINPDAVGTLKLDSVLLIPVLDSKKALKMVVQEVESVTTLHEVLTKETLYGISKQYGITVDAIKKANPVLGKSALKIGQKIIIIAKPIATVNSAEVTLPILEAPIVKVYEKILTPKVVKAIEQPDAILADKNIKTTVHEVLQKETKYGIAKQYGIKVADLDKANPELGKKGLEIGQKINIPVKEDFMVNPIVEKPVIKPETKNVISEKEPTKTEIVVANTKTEIAEATKGQFNHEVLSKETKYGIAKQYGITVQELEKQNPSIANKLLVGTRLTILSANSEERVFENKPIIVPEKKEEVTTEVNSFPVYSDELVDRLIGTASENIGIRYRSGGTTKAGFDCSGLMWSTFEANNIDLPRSSVKQADFGTKIEMTEAKKGDLIFFKTNGSRQISHVGMVVEVIEDEIKFIHSSTSSGVMISSTKEKYYEKRIVQVSRVLH